MEDKKEKEYDGTMRLSPTSILTFRRCPREFYYHYVLKLPTPSNIHLIKGSVVHTVLENFFKYGFKDNLEDSMEDLFVKEWETYKEELASLNLPAEELERQEQDCRNMLSMFLRTFRIKMDGLKWSGKAENDRHAYYLLKPKFREKFMEDKDLNVCGFVDRIHNDFSGITTIGDYKTGSRYGIGIKDEYEIQCGIYALLYELNTGQRADYTSIIFIRFGEEVRTRVTPDQIKTALDVIKETHEKIKSDKMCDYPTNQSKFCKWCSFFEK